MFKILKDYFKQKLLLLLYEYLIDEKRVFEAHSDKIQIIKNFIDNQELQRTEKYQQHKKDQMQYFGNQKLTSYEKIKMLEQLIKDFKNM